MLRNFISTLPEHLPYDSFSERGNHPFMSSSILRTPERQPETVLEYPIQFMKLCNNDIVRMVEDKPKLVSILANYISNYPLQGFHYLEDIKNRNRNGFPRTHLLFDFMGPLLFQCPHMKAFGSGDEEKRFCWTKEYDEEKRCTVFSVGSNNQYGFEEDIIRKAPNCHVHIFDCTLPNGFIVPSSLQEHVSTYDLCLGAENSGKFRTFIQLIEIAQVDHVTLIKFDIEGYEWPVLEGIIQTAKEEQKRTGKILLPDQIAVEIHYGNAPGGLPWNGRDRDAGEMHFFFQYLFFSGGYVLAERRDNILCEICSEILLVRVVC